MGVCQFVRVVQVVDSLIVITETMETLSFCGNHSNLFDALVMESVFTDYIVFLRLLYSILSTTSLESPGGTVW